MNAAASSLELACTSLWAATLSLMVAYMHNTAPAHRLLLARRIAGNFRMLSQQDVFSADAQASFGRLQLRWEATAQRLAAPGRNEGGSGLLGNLLRFRPQHL